MRAVAPLPGGLARGQLRLVRPLLCLERSQVESYCREADLEFRTDSSNQCLDYARNMVRIEVIPLLNKINPDAVRTMARAAEALGREHEFVQAYADGLLEQTSEPSDETGGEQGSGENATGRRRNAETRKTSVGFSVESFARQTSAVRNVMIARAAERAMRLLDVPSVQITSRHIAAIDKLVTKSSSGKRVELPSGVEAWRDSAELVFKTDSTGVASKRDRRKDRATTAGEEPRAELDGLRSEVEFLGRRITAERGRLGSLLEELLAGAREAAERLGRDWMVVVLSEDRLPSSLTIRTRRPGERALVVGQSKTKKLKKLMIDHRIPSSRRSGWPIVTTADGSYVWSAGLPPSIEFAARDQSKSLVVLRASNA